MADIEVQTEVVEGIGKRVAFEEAAPPSPAAIETVPQNCVEALRRVEVFRDLPAEQLAWFIENSDERTLAPGEILFRKGDAPRWMLVYLEGEVHARRDENSLDGFVYIARAGDPATEVTGKLPFSRMKATTATGRAVARTRVLLFPVGLFPELIERMPTLAERLVWIMTDRVRETTIIDERRDKLMALGKLSAGLAHELNNPAAAARRSVDELLDAIENLRAVEARLDGRSLSHDEQCFLTIFERETIAGAESDDAAFQAAGALVLSDREDALSDWLEARGVEDAWELARPLAEAGLDETGLEKLAERLPAEALTDALKRLVLRMNVQNLAREVKTSVSRISDLVGAIKEYSYMDQAAVQKVDLHRGIENTLLILKHKLKKKNISVVREYDENLPRLVVHGSLLNQVWTNLIDNAVDAMTDGGRLKIRTKREPEAVMIEIRDNGRGIPAEVQPHIFEPFYTTKGVNEGTGLGLDTVLRIVRKHRGHIRFETKPGDTCFQVRLPLGAADQEQ